MRLGISVTSSIAADDPSVGARMMIERSRAAWTAGLDSLSVGDHHSMRTPYFQNTPMLGRLLAEWDGRPAGCLFLLPLWNPVLAAEHAGTLAAMVDAPFIVQTGIGSGDAQFAAMGADPRTRGRTTDESIRVMQLLLAGETASSDLLGLADAAINPHPVQPVEWWIGGHSDAAIDRAARLGTAWYVGPNLTADALAALAQKYRAACSAHDSAPRIIVRRDALLLADRSEAESLADLQLAVGYRGMGRETVLVGDADAAVEQLKPLAALGCAEIVARCMSPDQGVAVGTINQLGNVRRRLAAG